MIRVQVLTLARELEWEGTPDELLQGNSDLSAIESHWLETLAVGQEFQSGGSETFIIRRST